MQNRSVGNRITEGVIWKQILIYFFPILLGAFFQQMYNTVDTIIVGRFVSTQALAATGAAGPMISLLNGFFVGLSTGATVLLSQFFGSRDSQGVSRALHTGIGLSVVLGLIITVAGIGAGPGILELMQTPENCLAEAKLYTVVYFSGAIASMIYNMGAGILRAMGDSKKPTIFLIVACGINILADLLFVVVFHMGVAGAALATVMSQIISAVLVLRELFRLPEEMSLRVQKIRLDRKLLLRILAIGVPAGLQFITFDLANLLIQSGVNTFGDITVAAWTALGKTDSVTWMALGALGVSITTFVGQNFGAQKYDRIRKAVWICMGMGLILVGTLSTLIVLLRYFILGIYTTDAQVIASGAQIVVWVVPYAVIFVPVEVFAGTMRGTGYSVMPTVITCMCVCVFRVIWLFTVVEKYHTVRMMSLCYPISWVLAATVFFIAYFRGNWLRKRIAACSLAPEQR